MSRDIVGIVGPRLVATVVAFALAAWALNGLHSHSATGTVRSLAGAIEEGHEPRTETLDHLDERSADSILAKCGTADLRALSVVRLKELDLSFARADPTRAERAGRDADAAIRKGLSCAPLDGNLWLQLAMLQTARSGPSSTTFDFVRLSHWIAPSEGKIVRARVNFTSQLFAAGLKEVQPELRSDIRTLVSFDTPSSIADMFFAAPESVRPIYREWIDLLPAKKKSRVVNALERDGGNLNVR